MGDYRLVVDAVGRHGCGRQILETTAAGEVGTVRVLERCGQLSCPDCMLQRFIDALSSTGATVWRARIEHAPSPAASPGMERRAEEAGPIDDLLAGTRTKPL